MTAEVSPTKLGAPAGVEPRKSRPIVWFAGVGAAFLILEVYIFAAWIMSGPKPTPVGDDQVPLAMKIAITAVAVGGACFNLAMVWFYLIKPWRREGRISTDGLLLIAIWSLVWQDPLGNWLQTTFTYNAWQPNFGAWTDAIPGWQSPNGSKLAEPILLNVHIYIWAFAFAVFACWIMNKVRHRFPAISKAGLVVFCFAFFWVLNAVGESVLLLRTGYLSYVNAPAGLTLFHGHYYQFPLYEALLFGSVMAGFALLRYFRNDKGETIVERGSSDLRISPRRKTFVRFLAILGALNAMFLAYNIVFIVVTTQVGPWIDDVTDRSYLMNQMCGEGTSYHCSAPDLPIPRGEDSFHINPDGILVDGHGNPAVYKPGS